MPEKNQPVRLQAIVSGRVQGVSFRYYTMQEARKLNLTGWVRNERDGTVCVVAEGPREQLELLKQFLHRGPPSAQVANVDASWHEATGEFDRFFTRYT